METIKIRGLAVLASTTFAIWGGIVFLKGLWDLFIGEPEANLYSLRPWGFVTQEQWLRWGGFELAYAAACLGLAWYCWRFSKRLPLTVTRKRKPVEFSLFDDA